MHSTHYKTIQKKSYFISFHCIKWRSHFKPSKKTTMSENNDLSSKNLTMNSIKELIREEGCQTKTKLSNQSISLEPWSIKSMQNVHVPYLFFFFFFFSHFMVIHELIGQFLAYWLPKIMQVLIRMQSWANSIRETTCCWY